MEKILRSQKMAEITLLPIRHHSPACASHVRSMIEKIRPSVILVEGPENANELIKDIIHPETRAPFAIYYSFHDKKGKVSGKKEHYKCYYPFLDYSPELVALRTGAQYAIPVRFIDLSYGEILCACQKDRGLRKDAEKNNYNDDYYLSQNEYLSSLCEKTGLRNFDEFWEKYFEIPAGMEDEAWFENLLIYCRLARENTRKEQLEEEGCLAREAHMAERILQYAGELSGEGSVLVITGGFHTSGLLQLLKGETLIEKRNPFSGEQGVYLMPYSMEAADALNGYASGMPYAGFYQKIWEQNQDYDKVVLDLIVRTGREARRKEASPSTYDDICAYQMAQDLADLREKTMPGVYELQDAVLGSFVKGECTIAANYPMRILKKHLMGGQIGTLWEGCEVPPIVQDFRSLCKTYGLPLETSIPRTSALNIFTSDKHRQMSRFFHRTLFLGTGFAIRKKGPNLQNRSNRYLIREIWEYKWTIQVDASLIDASLYGGTLEEAANELVRIQLQDEVNAGKATDILIQVFEMGLTDHMIPVYDRVCELVQKDTDFFSLADSLKSLLMLQELVSLYDSELDFESLTHVCIRKLIMLLPSQTRMKNEDSENYMKVFMLLYQLCNRDDLQMMSEKESFLDALKKMIRDTEIHPGIHGCIHGILYGFTEESEEQIQKIGNGYLKGTKERKMQTAQFFHGLFFAARDLIFASDAFLRMLDTFFGEVDPEEFMELLPELRMAFSFFIPAEIDRIAKEVVRCHHAEGENLLQMEEVLPQWYAYGRALDEYADQKKEGGRG